MDFMNLRRWLIAAVAMSLGTVATAQNAVRISEFHYDNAGADVGEAVEISGPSGLDLTGWQVVLYNGNGGASYDTRTLAGPVPASCDTRGVVVLDYPANGIQNGSPDGIALVDASGALVEFLSYEGVFAATNGAANGVTSVDIGVFENGNGPAGESLARNAAGTWTLGASSFGVCNDDGTTPPVAEVASVNVAPASATVTVGASLSFSATALDAASQPVNGAALSWNSSNPAVASVSATGVALGVAAGDTTIVATAANGVFGTAALHVNDAPPPTISDFHLNEIHYDNLGTDTGEAIEVEGPAGADISGFTVVLYNGNGGVPYNTQTLSGLLPTSCTTRGVVVVSYPPDGIQNGSPDGVALVDASGQVLEFLSYEGVFAAASGPAAGLTSVDILASETNAALGTSLQRNSLNQWAPGASSFGGCNPEAPTPVGNSLSFTGRNSSDPALPVGFEDQLFATLRSPGNVTIPTTITWSSEAPAMATIDQRGVLHALAAGTAIVRATAADGTTATYSLPTRIAVASTTAQYAGNAEFGEPSDADPSDDFIVRHEQYTASYNPNRGTPNWVSYDLEASHFGAEDRCDCFTADPALPASFPPLSTADYTDAGTFAGYGIDRGHMTRSFDRTTASLDNARTYYFTNVVPQASDLNQGPWAIFENYLGDLARVSNDEVYIITGPAGNKGTLKNEGKIVIPTSTWKVAVILPRDHGLADIVDYRDLQVIAVNMPNEPGVRNVPWQDYQTTVDAIEALTGYDLLALLPDEVEVAVESATQPPIAAISGPAGAVAEGDAVNLSAAASLDPNGTVVGFAWDFGDGATDAGVSVTHVYAQDGTYTARVTVTDNDGLTGTRTFVVHVTNVAPVIGALADASVSVGASYSATGSFADPGADTWVASVDFGDGSPTTPAVLDVRNFTINHTYAAAGVYTVTVQISDGTATSLSTHTVTVTEPAPMLGQALPLIDQLVATGKLSRAIGAVLKAEVVAAQLLVARGNEPAAAAVLRATVAEIDLLVRLRVASAATLAPLRALLVQSIGTLGA